MARGAVHRYKDGWSIRYDAGIDEKTNRRKQPFESGFTTRQEAEAQLALRLHEVATGRYIKPTSRTFGEMAAYWLSTRDHGAVRPRTLTCYETIVRRHLIPSLGTLPIQGIKPSVVNQFYQRCAAKKLTGKTLSVYHAVLRQIFQSAVDDQLLGANVMDKVARPASKTREMTIWAADELQQFLTLTKDSPFAVLWHIYAMTGVRRSEGLGIRWSDIDWPRRLLHIRQQVVLNRGILSFGPPKNAAGRRSIMVGEQTMDLLREHRRQQHEVRLKSPYPWHNHDLVFARQDMKRNLQGMGAPWMPGTITKAFTAEVAALDLPTIRLHDLRHTHATIMLAEDGNVKALAARLGHDPAILLRIYAHALPEHEARAVSRFEAALTARTHAAAGGR